MVKAIISKERNFKLTKMSINFSLKTFLEWFHIRESRIFQKSHQSNSLCLTRYIKIEYRIFWKDNIGRIECFSCLIFQGRLRMERAETLNWEEKDKFYEVPLNVKNLLFIFLNLNLDSFQGNALCRLHRWRETLSLILTHSVKIRALSPFWKVSVLVESAKTEHGHSKISREKNISPFFFHFHVLWGPVKFRKPGAKFFWNCPDILWAWRIQGIPELFSSWNFVLKISIFFWNFYFIREKNQLSNFTFFVEMLCV